MLYLAVLYFLLLAFLAWKNFRLAVAVLIISLPAYLVRFDIGPLPTTLLELSFGSLFLVWIFKYAREDWKKIKEEVVKHKAYFVFLAAFLLASLGSVFVSDMWWASLGQWRAYFLEPILFFIMVLGRKESFKQTDLIWFLLLSSISVSVVAIIQKVTGQFYPPSLWDDQLFGRSTSFFTSPNAVGLFLTPIFLAGLAVWKQKKVIVSVVLSLALLAILFSFSQGAWIALGVGVVCFVYLIGYKKIAIGVVLLSIAGGLLVSPVRQAVLFQDKASQNRLILWSHSWHYLSASPTNFILGAGIRQYFRKIEKPFYNPKLMERLIYPHNIFLNFWTETGLLGALSFVGIFACGLWRIYKQRKNNVWYSAAVVAALVAFAVHGLVDVPYFKNDLSFLFWTLMILPL